MVFLGLPGTGTRHSGFMLCLQSAEYSLHCRSGPAIDLYTHLYTLHCHLSVEQRDRYASRK